MSFYKDSFILDEGITYLNCANISPMLYSVKEAGLVTIETRSTPWNIMTKDWFTNAEILRELVSHIFQTSQDNIALVPSVSYGLAVAAKNLKITTGKSVLILENQFPSNYYVWQNLAALLGLQINVIKRNSGLTLTESIVECMDSKTGLVALPHCHWMDGALIDLETVSKKAKSVGSYLVLDISQSLGVLPIDIEKIQPDFAVSVGYKWLLGPYGLGYMYVSPKWHDVGEPLEYSWLTRKGSDDFTSLCNYVKEYRTGARKFDMGEFPQFNLLPMSIAALRQILDWKVSLIQEHLKKLTDLIKFNKRLQRCSGQLNNPGHIISIPLLGLDENKLKHNLNEKRVIVSYRGTSIRVSPYLHNTTEDIEKLLSCLPP